MENMIYILNKKHHPILPRKCEIQFKCIVFNKIYKSQ